MIEIKEGDIFMSQAGVLVNPVNKAGFMGALAGQFAIRYPEMKAEYEAFTRRGGWHKGTKIQLGDRAITLSLQLCRTNDGKLIVNLPTIHDESAWRSSYDGIRGNLSDLAQLAEIREFDRVAVPALGCGVGGLNFDTVKDLMEHYLSELATVFEIYKPR